MNTYEIITNKIIDVMEQGQIPWHKPWSKNPTELPLNLVSKKAYRGINTFMLLVSGFSSQYWVTFNQAKALGGQVKKGEKGWPVIFWKWLEVQKDKTSEKSEQIPLLRYYTVFNIAQCDGLISPVKEESSEAQFEPIEICEKIVSGYINGPSIESIEDRAYYVPKADKINMPARNLFENEEEYYSTLFHEMTHSTGHEQRLNRKTLTDLCPFGSSNYSKEELVAEMGAAFLCGHGGIENKTIDNSAAYLQNWLKQLRNDKTLLVSAAAQAQKASDHILGKEFEADEE